MYMNKVRAGQIVLNKVDGKMYTINRKGEGFEAVEQLPKSTEELVVTQNRVEITEKNAIAFRLIEDPNPKDVPEGYKLSDGEFVTSTGEKVETGEIKVEDVLGAIPGAVVLITSKGSSRGVSLYYPEKDSFRFMHSFPEGVSYASFDFEGKVVVATSLIEIEKTEDDEEEKKILKDSTVVVVSEKGVRSYSIDYPMEINNIGAVDDLVVITTIGDVDEDDVITEGPRRMVIIDTELDEQYGAITLQGENPEVSKSRGGLLVITDKMVSVDADRYYVVTDKAAEMRGLDKVIDITIKDHALRITLANASLTEVKTLVKTRSEDKGAIYSVE